MENEDEEIDKDAKEIVAILEAQKEVSAEELVMILLHQFCLFCSKHSPCFSCPKPENNDCAMSHAKFDVPRTKLPFQFQDNLEPLAMIDYAKEDTHLRTDNVKQVSIKAPTFSLTDNLLNSARQWGQFIQGIAHLAQSLDILRCDNDE